MKKKYNNEEIIKGKVTYMPRNCKKQAFEDKKNHTNLETVIRMNFKINLAEVIEGNHIYKNSP